MSLSVPWKPADAVMDRVRALWPDAAEERRITAILGRLGPPYEAVARESVACAVLKLAGRDEARLEELVTEARSGPEAVARLRKAAGFTEWMSYRDWIPSRMAVRRQAKIGWTARLPAMIRISSWVAALLFVLVVLDLMLGLGPSGPLIRRGDHRLGPTLLLVICTLVPLLSWVWLAGRAVSRAAPVRFAPEGWRIGSRAGTWRDVAGFELDCVREGALEEWMLIVRLHPTPPDVRPLPGRLVVPLQDDRHCEAESFLLECQTVHARAEADGDGLAS